MGSRRGGFCSQRQCRPCCIPESVRVLGAGGSSRTPRFRMKPVTSFLDWVTSVTPGRVALDVQERAHCEDGLMFDEQALPKAETQWGRRLSESSDFMPLTHGTVSENLAWAFSSSVAVWHTFLLVR